MAILKIKDPPTGEWQEVTVMQGKSGPQGPAGPAGPNEITTETQTNLTGLLKGNGTNVQLAQAGMDYATPSDVSDAVSDHNSNASAHSAQFDKKQNIPTQLTALPDSGTALTAGAEYNVADPVDTYVFTPPVSGWAFGRFSTNSTSAAVSFADGANYLGSAPAIETGKTYEFSVVNGVWAVAEVVSA